MFKAIKNCFTGNVSPPRYYSGVLTWEKREAITDATIASNTNLVLQLLENGNFNPSDKLFMNKTKDSLLHLATRTKNYELAEFLIENNVEQTTNIFGETPANIAMKNCDNKMAKLLLENNRINELKQNNKDLKCDNELKTIALQKMTAKSLNFQENNGVLELSNKRLREDNDKNERVFKKLKTDHEDLTVKHQLLVKDNDTLKITYTNLRDSLKK